MILTSSVAPSTRRSPVVCWEALDPRGQDLRRARRLYKDCLAADERIPWRWIKEQVAGRCSRRWGDWMCHLLLAGMPPRHPDEDARVMGFAYGAYIPDYGGYLAYIAVAERYRGHGIAGRLMRLFGQLMRLDAECSGASLPFILWESRCPDADASTEERANWKARQQLFARAGAWHIDGLDFQAPNYSRRGGPPVPLRLFLQPGTQPLAAFDAVGLRRVVRNLQREVYDLEDDHPLFLDPRAQPFLRPLT